MSLMFRLKNILLLSLLLSVTSLTPVWAQNKPAREEDERVVQDFLERLIENEESNIDYTDLQDQLLYFYRNPINLNKAGKEQLQQLGFLTELQINNLLLHRLTFGDLLSVYELQVIEGFTQQVIQDLLLFATVNGDWMTEKLTFKKIFTQSRQEVYLMHQQTLQTQKGYTLPNAEDPDATNYYLGSPYRHLFRYNMAYGTRFSAGLIGEKDAGEQFFEGNNKNGFDFYSFHLFVRDVGKFKSIALGDFQAAFGQGLTFGSGLAFGKSPFVLNVKRNYQSLRPYRSVNENEFLRGAAFTYALHKKIEFTTFLSHKKIDGNIASNTDTIFSDESAFTSIISSGFHRTPNEIKDKQTVTQTITGGHLRYKLSNFQLGLTAVHTTYDQAFQRDDKPYNRFEFSGKSLLNTGMDYTWYYRNVTLFGEVSSSSNGAMATSHGLLASLHPKVDLSIVYRNFAKDYHTTYSSAFGENSRNINEQGFYMGISVRPVPKWTINAYTDVYSSPWLKYLVDAPSRGYDYMAELNYAPSRTVQMYWRFRNDNKEKNATGNETVSDYLVLHRRYTYRYQISYKVSPSFTLKNRVEFSEYQTPVTATEKGTVFIQDVQYKPLRGAITFIGRAAYFSTDGYNSRLYAFENDLLYQFSVPALQDKGMRYFLLIRYKPIRSVDVWLKLGSTVYTNKNTVGSGLDEINGNARTDLKIQVRYSF